VLEWGEKAPCITSASASILDGLPDGVRDNDQAKQGSEFQVSEDPEDEPAENGWWDLEMGYPSLENGEVKAPQAEPPHHLPHEASRPDHSIATRKEQKSTAGRQWEEVRQNARLRQTLSGTPSGEDEDEDEERHGRFAESGRWMPELYEPP
jgi:hypothetical protein